MLMRLVPPASKIHPSNNTRQRDDVRVRVGWVLRLSPSPVPSTRLACTPEPCAPAEGILPSAGPSRQVAWKRSRSLPLSNFHISPAHKHCLDPEPGSTPRRRHNKRLRSLMIGYFDGNPPPGGQQFRLLNNQSRGTG